MAADDLFNQLPIPQVTPEALGVPPLAPPPTPPSLAPAKTMNPWIRTVMGALAAGLGPGAGTGLLQGANAAEQQNEQRRRLDYATAQKTYEQQQRDWEIQDRLTQQEADRRQTLYQNSIADLRNKAVSGQLANRDDYDRFMNAYAAGLQQQGLRGVSANTLRSAVPYISPDVSKIVYQKVDQLFKDPEQRKLLENNPKAGEGTITYIDPGDKLPHPITLNKAIALSNYPALLNADGSLMPVGDKPLTPSEAAGKAGVFQRAQQALIASGAKPGQETDAKAQAAADKWETDHKVETTVAEKKALKAAGLLGPNESGTTAATIQPGDRRYKVAEDLAFGRLTFKDFRTLYAYSRDKDEKTAIYEKAGEINPNFNPAGFELGYRFASNPKVEQQIASANNVLAGVPDLLKASDAAAGSGKRLINDFIPRGGLKIGGRAYTNFAAARKAFADELSGALGFGSASDMKLQLGLDLTDPTLSPADFKDAVQNVVVPFVQRKKASLLGPMGIYGAVEANPGAAEPSPPASDGDAIIAARRRANGGR